MTDQQPALTVTHALLGMQVEGAFNMRASLEEARAAAADLRKELDIARAEIAKLRAASTAAPPVEG